MERGCSTGRHFPHLMEQSLLEVFCKVCPKEGPMIECCMGEQQDVLHVVGVLCVLYRFQDRVIHQFARKQDPSLSISFGDREWNWIQSGGPAAFFARVEKTIREHYPEVFDTEIMSQAWGYFQVLLTGEHIVYTSRLMGHIPSHEEYFNPGLTDWYFRLAMRFSPLRPLPKETVQ